MGFTTIVAINNDSLEDLDDPEYGKKLAKAIKESYGQQNYPPPGLNALVVAQYNRYDGPVELTFKGGRAIKVEV